VILTSLYLLEFSLTFLMVADALSQFEAEETNY
jgi:hypothetical protein